MLADDRIKFFHLQLFGCGALVLGRSVEMPRTRRGNQLDFVTHGNRSLKLFTSGTQFGKNGVDPLLINDAHPVARHAQAYEALFAFDPEPMDMQVRQKTTTGSVVGVRYIISSDRALARHLTNSGHRMGLQPV